MRVLNPTGNIGDTGTRNDVQENSLCATVHSYAFYTTESSNVFQSEFKGAIYHLKCHFKGGKNVFTLA